MTIAPGENPLKVPKKTYGWVLLSVFLNLRDAGFVPVEDLQAMSHQERLRRALEFAEYMCGLLQVSILFFPSYFQP